MKTTEQVKPIQDADVAELLDMSSSPYYKLRQSLLLRVVDKLETPSKINSELLEAARIGLACCIAWGGKCEANGEHILAEESRVRAEQIRSAIASAVH